jgi:hypothetical protein
MDHKIGREKQFPFVICHLSLSRKSLNVDQGPTQSGPRAMQNDKWKMELFVHFAPADNPLIFTATPLCAGFSLT